MTEPMAEGVVPRKAADPGLDWSRQIQRIALAALIVLILWLDYHVLQPFLGPLVWALVVAVFTWPLHERVAKRVAQPGRAALASWSVPRLPL